MKLIETIRCDLQTFYSYPNINNINFKVSFLNFLKALFDIDFRAVLLFRISYSLVNNGMKRLGILFYYRLKSGHAIDISPYSSIGPGLKIVHAFNIVVGPDVIIGKNCVLFNSVSLGNSHPGWNYQKKLKNSMPIIGDRVVLCPGVRVIGKVKVENDSLIGANSVVLNNISTAETWAGIPAKMISKRNVS